MEEEQNMKLNPRNDKDMAFMLRFENVAWYEDGGSPDPGPQDLPDPD